MPCQRHTSGSTPSIDGRRPSGWRAWCAALATLTVLIGGCGPAVDTSVIRVVDGKPQATRFVSPSAYTHLMYARIFLSRGQFARAEGQVRRALFFDPESPYLLTELAELLVRQRRWHAAMESLDEALSIRRGYPDALLLQAKIQWKKGRPDRAASALRRCVSFNPNFVPCHTAMVAHHERLGAFDDGREVLVELLKRTPDSVEARRRMARFCYRTADYRCSADHGAWVLRRQWDLKLARCQARVLRALGRMAGAVSLLRHAFDRSGGDAAVAARLLEVLRQTDRPQEMDDLLQVMRDHPPRSSTALEQLVGLHIRAGRAELVLKMARESGKDDPGRRLAVARLLLSMGRDAEALKMLSALAKGPHLVPATLLMARHLERKHELQAAVDRVRAAMAQEPASGHDDLVLVLARLLRHQGRNDEAARELSEIARRPGSDPAVSLELALSLQRSGDVRRALATARKVLRRNASDPQALNFVGYLLVQHNDDLDEAEAVLRRALFLSPDSPHILDSLGWLAHRKKQWGRARKLLGAAYRLSPQNHEIIEHYAEVQIALDRHARAIQLLKSALSHCVDTGDEGRIRRRLRTLEKQRVGTR